MSPDALRRLQALRGLTRIGPIHTVIAQVQGDLQTVIEAVLELAGHDDEHEPATDEPAVGEQVTDSEDDVWQRFEDGWRWWGREEVGGWAFWLRSWDCVQTYGPLRPTTDDDRRRVGLPVSDENTPPASQNGTPCTCDEAPPEIGGAQHRDGCGGPPEPENAAQGRIGWLRLSTGEERRYLVREVPGGWTYSDDDRPVWLRENRPDAEFAPIRTLADDEVAVQRDDLETALRLLLEGDVGPIDPSTPFLGRLRAARGGGS